MERFNKGHDTIFLISLGSDFLLLSPSSNAFFDCPGAIFGDLASIFDWTQYHFFRCCALTNELEAKLFPRFSAVERILRYLVQTFYALLIQFVEGGHTTFVNWHRMCTFMRIVRYCFIYRTDRHTWEFQALFDDGLIGIGIINKVHFGCQQVCAKCGGKSIRSGKYVAICDTNALLDWLVIWKIFDTFFISIDNTNKKNQSMKVEHF